MKKTLLYGFGALAAVMAAMAPVHAAVLVTSSAGLLPVSASNLAFFDDVSGAPQANPNTPFGPFTDGGMNFSGGGIIVNTSSSGQFAQPANDPTSYLAVLGGSSESVFLPNGFAANTLGLYWGSIDTYNTITFLFNGTQVDQVTGSAAATPANGDQSSLLTNTYINISGLSNFNEVILSSSQNSFELDNLSTTAFTDNMSNTPIPGSLFLLAGGLGLLGMFGWRRKQSQSVAFAA